MRQLSRLFTFLLFIIALGVHLDAHAHRHHPSNNFLPNIRLVATPRFNNDTSFVSFLGEGGSKLWRANVTYGNWQNPCNRFKVGAEYLNERLHFNFFRGSVERWVQQYAFGGTYQYIFDCWGIHTFDIEARYSRAPSHHLSGLDRVHTKGSSFPLNIHRRIAGSHAWDTSLGVSILPWCCSTLNFAAVYDHVNYDTKFTKFNCSHKHENGFGGIIGFTQYFGMGIDVKVQAEFRKPYRYYEAQLNWRNGFSCGDVTAGLYLGHLDGKFHLPSSTQGGVQVRFDFGVARCTGACYQDQCCALDCEYLAWLATPAVYMPQVLAKSDERTTSACHAPSSTTIPNVTIAGTTYFSYQNSLLPFFNGNGFPLTFGSTIVTNTGVANAIVTVDSSTGLLNVTGTTPGTLTIQIWASSNCGATSQTFNVVFAAPDIETVEK